jgi:23S rRNA (guanosine2251-2'-O)-methyltransferase
MAGLPADVYGRWPVLEALRAGHVARVYLARETRDAAVLREIRTAASAARVPVEVVSRAMLDAALPHRNHQGIAAAYRQHPYAALDDIIAAAPHPGLVLALDGIQDAGNLGALLRTADAAGVAGVVLPRHRAAGVTPAVARASAGAAEHIAIAQETNLTRALERFKQAGYWVVGLDQEAKQLYSDLDAARPLVVVIGGEGKGLSRLVREACDVLVRLPMRGHVATLNAAAAGAIVLYDIMRRRDAMGARNLDLEGHGRDGP